MRILIYSIIHIAVSFLSVAVYSEELNPAILFDSEGNGLFEENKIDSSETDSIYIYGEEEKMKSVFKDMNISDYTNGYFAGRYRTSNATVPFAVSSLLAAGGCCLTGFNPLFAVIFPVSMFAVPLFFAKTDQNTVYADLKNKNKEYVEGYKNRAFNENLREYILVSILGCIGGATSALYISTFFDLGFFWDDY